MQDYLRRLVSAGAAYQVADIVAKAIALGTLPLYTRHLTRGEYGTAETLVTIVILVSIVLRLGVGEAFVRFYFSDEDPERRTRLARSATGFVLATTTPVALVATFLAEPLSELVLGFSEAGLMRFAILGLWAFTNLEVAYALLRVDERRRTYVIASVSNVLLTVGLTIVLVVVRDDGARGLVAGNFVASAVVLLALWWVLRDRIGLRPERGRLAPLLRFGVPIVPAEASVFALNVIDRAYLLRVESPAAAGLYTLSVKLATVVIVAVRGFQYAWPPLAYSVSDDDEARRLYAAVTTYYVLATGLVVAALTLLGRWAVRLLAAPSFYPAHEALPWVALGWALYGLFLVLVVLAGRTQVTTRNFPAAFAGLVVNVVLLVTLVDPLGIAGAGIALCGAYAVMLILMHAFTRNLFPVEFDWGRLIRIVAVLAGVTVAGEVLLPTSGWEGFALRAAACISLAPALLASGALRRSELARVREMIRTGRARGQTPADPASPLTKN